MLISRAAEERRRLPSITQPIMLVLEGVGAGGPGPIRTEQACRLPPRALSLGAGGGRGPPPLGLPFLLAHAFVCTVLFSGGVGRTGTSLLKETKLSPHPTPNLKLEI